MNLFDILACPNCKVAVLRQADSLLCQQCQRSYLVINNVPVMLPDASLPETSHENELNTWPEYSPWIHRLVLQSLTPASIMLDLGAGNMAYSLPNLIGMDLVHRPYVDVGGAA